MPGDIGKTGFPGPVGIKGEQGDDGAFGPKGSRVSESILVRFNTSRLYN